jgi:hypothetical protein
VVVPWWAPQNWDIALGKYWKWMIKHQALVVRTHVRVIGLHDIQWSSLQVTCFSMGLQNKTHDKTWSVQAFLYHKILGVLLNSPAMQQRQPHDPGFKATKQQGKLGNSIRCTLPPHGYT